MFEYRIGSSGSEVKEIQRRCGELTLYHGPVDGVFGGNTEAAVKTFQQREGLAPDGKVGPSTWNKLFPSIEMPRPAILDQTLDYRCLALTGTFETGSGAPDCFCALSGDFDGQGLSFGVLQWNFGQDSLQPLLREFVSGYPEKAKTVFHDELNVVTTALAAPQEELMRFSRSIQHPVKHVVNEPWRGMAKALGRTPEFQSLQVKHASGIFKRALAMCEKYALKSERAAMLMFDICVQNGSINDIVHARIVTDFKRLPGNLDSQQEEVLKMQIIGNRRADAADPRWAEDVRSRKLTIANGEGVVHGVHINLATQFNITLSAF